MTTTSEKIDDILNSEILYPHAFIQTFGLEDIHWGSSNSISKEKSLRHDMVCLLLCNLEKNSVPAPVEIEEVLEPPAKRRRLEESSTGGSSSASSSDRGIRGDHGEPEDDNLSHAEGGEARLRYILLEGRSNLSLVQNKLADFHKLPRPQRHYDIFDQKEKKFIEVKCTVNLDACEEEFDLYNDPDEMRSFFHIHPETLVYSSINKIDAFPGLAKVLDFLAMRQTVFAEIPRFMEAGHSERGDLSRKVMSNSNFNEMMAEWVHVSFWNHRKETEPLNESRLGEMTPIGALTESVLKNAVEDTSKRDAPFMQFRGKILPPPMVDHIDTNADTDSGMLDALLLDVIMLPDQGEKAEIMSWLLKTWNESEKNTFSFVRRKELKQIPNLVKKDLGIGIRTTVKNDYHSSLKQPEFSEHPKARYSAWMSNLLQDLCCQTNLNCLSHLAEQETPDPHPMAKVAAEICDHYYQVFSETKIATYCSMIKNTYSRLGGAYLKRGYTKGETPEIVIFPIYAVGHVGNETRRWVTGFLVRGPQHARKPNDRIPIVTVELATRDERKIRYIPFIRNAHLIKDTTGRTWIYRVNSITNISPSFLTYITNATYLGANLVGELTIGNPTIPPDYPAAEKAIEFVTKYSAWLMERVAEGVMMAVTGGSQEEGTLAIVRKIFMIKLNSFREKAAYGSDIDGLADALNECLLDSPFALYLGQQARMALLD